MEAPAPVSTSVYSGLPGVLDQETTSPGWRAGTGEKRPKDVLGVGSRGSTVSEANQCCV